MKPQWILLGVIGILAVLAMACGGPGPTPSPTATPTPSPTPTGVATAPVTKEPTDEGLCIPAGPLKVSVGDSWTIAGPLQGEGERGEIPESAVRAETNFTVKAIEASDRRVGDATVNLKSSRVQVQIDQVWRDEQGKAVKTYEEEGFRAPIMVTNLGPVLTLDWECHRKAWLQAPWMNVGVEGAAEVSVEERTLSGSPPITAMVFSITQIIKLPEQGTEATSERLVGYDKLTGRIVLIEAHASGTVNGQPSSSDAVQQVEEGL